MERQREQDISGKVAIMTGASRGVGKEAALALARRGAKVVLAARTVEPHPDPTLPGTLGETLHQIEQAGGEAIAVATDLAKVEDLQNLVDRTVERFGGVDILINNAAATVGDYWNDTFLELSREDWLYQFDVNVHAPFTLMQLTIPIMTKRGGGRIINVTTGSAEVFRLPEETRHKNLGKKNLEVPGYFCPKRALDRLGSIIADSHGAAQCPHHRPDAGLGSDRNRPGAAGTRSRRARHHRAPARRHGHSGADDRLFLGLREPGGIHRPAVLRRARAGGHGDRGGLRTCPI